MNKELEKVRKSLVVEKIRNCADMIDDVLGGSIYCDELRALADKIDDLIIK